MIDLFMIDIYTVILLIFLGNILIIAILAAYKSASTPRRTYWHFLAGKLFQAVAWLLLGQRGKIPDLYSAYLGNSLLLIGFALEALALVTVDAPNRRWEKIYTGATVFSILLFCGLARTPNQYVVVASLATAAIYSTASFSLLTHISKSRLRWVLGAAYGMLGLLLILRAWIAFFSPQKFGLLTHNPIQSASFMAVYLLMILSSVGFLLLIRERSDDLLDQANQELNQLAHVDGLTNLANRRAFDEALSRAVRESRRSGQPLALIMMDIDFFKNYNDCYGHSTGDECLSAVGHWLQKVCRRGTDLVARYGGEEFAMILPDTDSAGVCLVAESIRQGIYDLAIFHTTSDAADRITFSLGAFSAIAISESQNESWYIDEADRRLYTAKNTGRNRSICT